MQCRAPMRVKLCVCFSFRHCLCVVFVVQLFFVKFRLDIFSFSDSITSLLLLYTSFGFVEHR